MMGPEANVESFIEDHKRRADLDPYAPPFDDLRNYAYEGGGSTAGSLSSLGSGTKGSKVEVRWNKYDSSLYYELSDLAATRVYIEEQ